MQYRFLYMYEYELIQIRFKNLTYVDIQPIFAKMLNTTKHAKVVSDTMNGSLLWTRKIRFLKK